MSEAIAPAVGAAIDPIALEVIWSRLIAVVNEQAAALVRTSFTPSVAEAGDLSACVFDARGHLLAHAVTGTPGHINSMEMCMKHLVRIFPPETLEPGDVLITNDPWIASGHLHDLSVITPAFRPDGRVVGFFGNVCHVADIGGIPFSADGRSRFEEGLFIPPLKLYKAGRPNEELFAFVRANVRSPDEVASELQSMTTANDVGAARLLESMAEFGLADIEGIADAIIGRTEAATRAAIRALPDGVYRNQITCDGYDRPITLAVTITIDGDEMRVDYAGSSPESPRGINVVLNYTRAYTTYALTCLLTPEAPNNEGAFRPVQVAAPEGCILNCRPPAPVSARHILGHFLPGLIFGALAPVVPERMMAEGSANLWNIQLHGHWRDGAPFNLLWFNAGGTGARPALDGLSSTAFPSGVSGTAVEIIESRVPIVVRRRQLRRDSGGAGRQRGGLGHWLVLQGAPRTDRPYTLSPFFDRTANPARGLAGGRPGGPGRFFLRHPDGREETPLPKQTIAIDPVTEVWVGLPGGGGYGDPRERDPALLLADVRAGLISPEAALADYGLAVTRDPSLPDDDPSGWELGPIHHRGTENTEKKYE